MLKKFRLTSRENLKLLYPSTLLIDKKIKYCPFIFCLNGQQPLEILVGQIVPTTKINLNYCPTKIDYLTVLKSIFASKIISFFYFGANCHGGYHINL